MKQIKYPLPETLAELHEAYQRLRRIEHAAWHALDDCEVREDGALIRLEDYQDLSDLLPEDHP